MPKDGRGANVGRGVVPDRLGAFREHIELREVETLDDGSLCVVEGLQVALVSLESFVVIVFVSDGSIAAPTGIDEILLSGNEHGGSKQGESRQKEEVSRIEEAEQRAGWSF